MRRDSRKYGRLFDHIDGVAGLQGEDFARSGVRLVLSPDRLDSPALREVGPTEGIWLYEALEKRPLEAWISASGFRLEPEGGAQALRSLARSEAEVERRPGPDERIELELEPQGEPGLLWLSQQFHPHWRARAGSEPLRTVLVDRFWQGILVPPGTREVVLEFRPWARWAWIPQVLFACAGAACLLVRVSAAVRGRRRR